MKAVCWNGKNQVSVETVLDPVLLNPRDAIVRITSTAICGSDLQYYAQGRIGELEFSAGHILGHEVAGVVEALGPDTDGPSPGTVVAVDPAIPCGWCRFCVAGDPNFCERLQFFGSPPRHGALQQYVTHPSRLLLPVPSEWSPAATAVLEPLGVALGLGGAVTFAPGTSTTRWPGTRSFTTSSWGIFMPMTSMT